MAQTLQCTNCGSDCCIDIALPRTIKPKCDNPCGKFIAKVKPDTVLKAGQLVAKFDDYTIQAFDPASTTGAQFAFGVVGEDIASDEKGLRVQQIQLGPNCEPAVVTVYAGCCQRFAKKDITGDLAAARASGLDIVEFGGEVIIGG